MKTCLLLIFFLNTTFRSTLCVFIITIGFLLNITSRSTLCVFIITIGFLLNITFRSTLCVFIITIGFLLWNKKTYLLGIWMLAFVIPPRFRLLHSASRRELFGVSWKINLLLSSYPVNRRMLQYRVYKNIAASWKT